MHQQMLLAGRGFIEPTLAVGALAFSGSDTSVYPGNALFYEKLNNTFTIPSNWKTKTYRYRMEWNSTAAYSYFAPATTVYKNGSVVASWSENGAGSGYYFSNSGILAHEVDVSLAAGDVLQAIMSGRGRGTGVSTPLSSCYHELKRLT